MLVHWGPFSGCCRHQGGAWPGSLRVKSAVGRKPSPQSAVQPAQPQESVRVSRSPATLTLTSHCSGPGYAAVAADGVAFSPSPEPRAPCHSHSHTDGCRGLSVPPPGHSPGALQEGGSPLQVKRGRLCFWQWGAPLFLVISSMYFFSPLFSISPCGGDASLCGLVCQLRYL